MAHLTIPADFRELMEQLSPAHREAVATLVQEADDAGVFNTLAYVQDQIAITGLRLVWEGAELPVNPYGMTLFEDWVRRRDDAPWPAAPWE